MNDSAQAAHFMPHGMCYQWNTRLLALHVISDALIALAYFSIPVILFFVLRKRRDFPFPAVLAMFGLFIVACGMTHVLEIVTIWHPVYWLSGGVKAFTACVSIATAVLLVGILPKALRIKGRSDLLEEVAELNTTLEEQVLVRTSELADANRSLEARTVEAETATSTKSQFLANMSHEIRSPMNAILGMLQLLQSTALSAHQSEYATKAYAATQALLRLLNDILDFSKIEAGKLTFEHCPFELDAMVRDVSGLLSASLGPKPVELLFVVDERLPERLQGDVFRLRQVLLNLAGNALKFTSHGEIVVEIRQVARRQNACDIQFSVIDTGIGVAPDKLTAIFEQFIQGEAATTRHSGGTGLGLTISQRIVALMGGRLEVESTLGRGSRFHFTLAFDYADDGVSKPVASARERVLLVDDNAAARSILLTIARSFGWESASAASGQEALDLIGRADGGRGYEMIFIDWTMPGLDGWETARRVRALVPTASIVLMSSAHDVADVFARTQADPDIVDTVLVKPVLASAMRDTVTELQARRSRVARAPDRPATPHRLRGRKILVVDDFAINLQIAGELLSIEGADVAVVNSGREAIGTVQRSPTPFDVVLMDVQMPEMDGYETTRRLRELPQMSGVAIVAVTANAMESDRAASRAAGMDDFIPKPIDIDVVVRTILDHVPHARSAPSNPVPANIVSALERMGNDRLLFGTIARRFIELSTSLIDELRTALESGALADATSVLHKLKGSGATVGNSELAELAAGLEAELKRTGRLSDPGNDLPRLASRMAAGNAELERFLADSEVVPAGLLDAPPRDPTADREQIVQLIALLGERNLRALDVYQVLAPTLKARLPAESHAVLAAAMNGLDFARAASVLAAAEPDR